jgi:hypothetical protein
MSNLINPTIQSVPPCLINLETHSEHLSTQFPGEKKRKKLPRTEDGSRAGTKHEKTRKFAFSDAFNSAHHYTAHLPEGPYFGAF